MATRFCCPHCRSSYRLPAEYNCEAVRCGFCERLFRVRLLLPQDSVLYGEENAEPKTALDGEVLLSEPVRESEARDPLLIPFERIEPPADSPPELQPQMLDHDELLPIDPPLQLPSIQFEVIEPAATPAVEPAVDETQTRSLLDSLDLTLSSEPYLEPVEPETQSLLDSLNLELRKDTAENTPIVLEEYETQASGGDPVQLSAVDENVPILELVGEPAPVVVLEALDPPPPPPRAQPKPAARNYERWQPKRANRSADDHYDEWPRNYSNRSEPRDYRRRSSDGPRRRPLPPASNWVSDNKAPILIVAMLLSVIVGAIVVVKIMEDRTPTRSSFADDSYRPKRFEAPDWQRNVPPPRMQPQFPQVDPGIEPNNDVNKPFAQPPMLEQKKQGTEQPKKPRKRNTQPQEKRDWVELAPASFAVDAKIDKPRIESKPVEIAARGTTYNYLLEVRARSNGAKALLEFGPPGMNLQPDSRLVWQVPDQFPDDEFDIRLRIREADGRECTQTFVISIR
jgi:hypothetical protein